MPALLELRDLVKSFGGVRALAACRSTLRARRGARARGRERRRQVARSSASSPARTRPDAGTLDARRPSDARPLDPLRRARARHRGHLPAAGALPGPLRRREHRARPRAGRALAPRRLGARRRARAPELLARVGRRRSTPTRRAGTLQHGRAAARARSRARSAPTRACWCMDEPTAVALRATEAAAPARAACASCARRGVGDRLRLAPARGGLALADRVHRAARRRASWRRARAAGLDRAGADPPDGRPRAGRRRCFAERAVTAATSCSSCVGPRQPRGRRRTT